MLENSRSGNIIIRLKLIQKNCKYVVNPSSGSIFMSCNSSLSFGAHILTPDKLRLSKMIELELLLGLFVEAGDLL
jgi:hypothetical protein